MRNIKGLNEIKVFEAKLKKEKDQCACFVINNWKCFTTRLYYYFFIEFTMEFSHLFSRMCLNFEIFFFSFCMCDVNQYFSWFHWAFFLGGGGIHCFLFVFICFLFVFGVTRPYELYQTLRFWVASLVQFLHSIHRVW